MVIDLGKGVELPESLKESINNGQWCMSGNFHESKFLADN
jgi:hypothetical protein